jgi:hypothetical protein
MGCEGFEEMGTIGLLRSVYGRSEERVQTAGRGSVGEVWVILGEADWVQ